jgi:hypothetical protein
VCVAVICVPFCFIVMYLVSLFSIVTYSQVLVHDGTLLHSKLNTQPLITIRNASRILTLV